MFKSMAETVDYPVDCRMIKIEMQIFQISYKQLCEVANCCMEYMNNLFSKDFYVRWDWNGRRSTSEKILYKINRSILEIKHFDFGCEADVLSDTVFDLKSFKRYDKYLFGTNDPETWHRTNISLDYMDIFDQYLPGINDPSRCKETILSLFYKEGKKMQEHWYNHDVVSLFMAYKYSENSELYCCKFKFQIALQCMNNAESVSCGMTEHLLNIANITPNVNAMIALSPLEITEKSCSPHMRYFGGSVSKNYMDTCIKEVGRELYRYYHLCGAEWFNLLSPMVSSRLHESGKEREGEEVQIKTLSNGVTVVRLLKKIDTIDVYDLLGIRRYLYPVLYPGGCRIKIEHMNNLDDDVYLAKPRNMWEVLPLFPEEITVSEDTIYMAYNHNFLS